MTAKPSRTADQPKSNQLSPKFTSSGSRPAWAATAIPFRSPRRRSPASKTCCWERFPAFPKSICTTPCWPTKSATTS